MKEIAKSTREKFVTNKKYFLKFDFYEVVNFRPVAPEINEYKQINLFSFINSTDKINIMEYR